MLSARPSQGLALFVRSVALGAEAAGVGLCSAEVLTLLKEALLHVRAMQGCVAARGIAGWHRGAARKGRGRWRTGQARVAADSSAEVGRMHAGSGRLRAWARMQRLRSCNDLRPVMQPIIQREQDGSYQAHRPSVGESAARP